MTEITDLLSVGLAVIAAAFALAITWTSFRTLRETRSTTHRYAFGGFLFLTGGILIEELMLRFSSVHLHTVHGLESLLFVIGFGFLYLSIR
ncbi:hypothetical protein KM295_05620 [Natronomonas sp. F2-12]|jgi:hypothetical protein|uniref:Uncharacterized protein n=1 Tax=Natronomonas aquatica TaxID=2841590 RepID=A0A9R1CSD9_9EURY|nr:hypothetical protein [Natronomonas aquatica]MCQ4332985.1 hypothetical protein [Natronomonas aquatica]